MGTTLTGKKVRDTYKSLIKVTNNTEAGTTGKQLSDGNGNDFGVYIDTDGVLGIGGAANVGLDVSNKNDAVHLAVGTDAQRPTASAGMIRYNTTNAKFEIYDGAWKNIFTESGGTIDGDVTVTGDLTVQGTTVTLNTETIEFEDNILQLNTTQGTPDTATATTSGISIYRGDGVNQASFIFDDADDTWDLTNDLEVDGDIFTNFVGVNTADSTDNERLHLGGGGGNTVTRGALIALHGNEYSTTGGELNLFAGTETTGHIKFHTGGNERLHIGFNGNIGIDEDDPSAKLDIKTTTAGEAALEINYSSGNAFQFQNGIANVTTDALLLKDSTNDIDYITLRGSKIGVGTTSPQRKLEIEDDSGAQDGSVSEPVIIRITDTAGSQAGTTDTTNVWGGLEWYSRDTSQEGPTIHAQIGAIYDDIYSAGSDLVFKTWNAGISEATERMRIDSSGNVGIGASPLAPLHVKSADDVLSIFKSTDNKASIQLSDDDTDAFISVENNRIAFGPNTGTHVDNLNYDLTNKRLGIGTNSPAVKFHVEDTGSQIGSTGFYYNTKISDDSNAGLLLGHNNTANGVGMIAGINEIAFLTYGTSWGERMRIHSNGSTEFKTGSTSTLDVANQTAGSIVIGNGSGSAQAPTIVGRSTSNATPLTLTSAATNTNTSGDMVFNVRENNNSTFATLTNNAFVWKHYTTDLMVVRRNGNVGINSTSPDYKLRIDSNADDHLKLNRQGVGAITMHVESGGGLVIEDDGTERMTITSDGHIQIAASEKALKWASGNGVVEAPNSLYIRTTGDSGSLIFQTDTTERIKVTSDGAIEIKGQGTGNTFIGDSNAGNKGTSTGTYNTAFGNNGLNALTTGTHNTAVGFANLINTTSGIGNVTLGSQALYYNTVGDYNIGIGYQALHLQSADINHNIGIGYQTLYNENTSGNNVAIGYASMKYTNGAGRNIAIGSEAMVGQSGTKMTGDENIGIGYNALNTNTTGYGNVAMGYRANSQNTTGSYNIALGFQALNGNTTPTHNIAIGYQALFTENTNGGNVAIGREALKTSNGGSGNVSVGYQSTISLTTGDENAVVGMQAGSYLTTGSYNAILGAYALDAGTTTDYNVAIGYGALTSQTTANHNTAVGYLAGQHEQATDNSTFIGSRAGRYVRGGSASVALGMDALYGDSTNYSSGDYNVAVGHKSLFSNNTGARNSALGTYALYDNTSGIDNVAVGYSSLENNTTGSYNISIGSSSLATAQATTHNIAIGYAALYSENTESGNVGIGREALRNANGSNGSIALGFRSQYNTTTGDYNATVGWEAGRNITTGSGNSFFGYAAGYGATASTFVTGTYNTGLGFAALYKITSGQNNVAIGKNAGYDLTTGSHNTAIGVSALENVTTGDTNVAVGNYALFYETTGNNNVAMGYNSLGAATTSSNNIAIGAYAMDAVTTQGAQVAIGTYSMSATTTGHTNTAVGHYTLFTNTTGQNNVAIGNQSLYENTTGDFNTAIGSYSLYSVTTGDRNTAIGYNAGVNIEGGLSSVFVGHSAGRYRNDGTDDLNPSESIYIGQDTRGGGSDATPSNEIVIGYQARGNGDNSATYGNSSITKHVFPAGSIGVGTDSPDHQLQVESTGNAEIQTQRVSGAGVLIQSQSAAGVVGTNTNHRLDLKTNGSTRVRITTGGNVLVGKTNDDQTSAGVKIDESGYLSGSKAGTSLYLNRKTSDGTVAEFWRNGTTVGSISVTSSATTYNTSSDYRLKTDLKDFNGSEMLSNIKMYDFAWKADESRSYGVMAHELQEVLPQAVSGEKDGEEMQAVDYSKIVPVLVKALQEQQAQIDELKSKLN